MPELLEHHPEIEQVLEAHAAALGPDRTAYANHVYRVLNLVRQLAPEQQLDRYAVCLAFHDLGIWTAKTFDYLAPSQALLETRLRALGRDDWVEPGSLALLWHHKLTRYRGPHADFVEPLRRADLADVSWGLVRAGLSGRLHRDLHRRFPSAGFHRRLIALTAREFLRHPLRPLPMRGG